MLVVKFILVLIALQQVAAFRITSSLLKRPARVAASSLQMQSSTDKSMLTSFGTKIVAAVTAGFLCTAPVMAANYGGFGSSYSEVINPKEAVINDEAVSTGEFKSGKEGLQNLLRVVQTLKTDLQSNNQMEVTGRVKSELDISKVRDALNKFNTAFSEDTQRGTDRLIRNVIQDVATLEREGAVKPGKQRSEVRVNNILKTLNAAESTLKELASFYPN